MQLGLFTWKCGKRDKWSVTLIQISSLSDLTLRTSFPFFFSRHIKTSSSSPSLSTPRLGNVSFGSMRVHHTRTSTMAATDKSDNRLDPPYIADIDTAKRVEIRKQAYSRRWVWCRSTWIHTCRSALDFLRVLVDAWVSSDG